MNRKLNIVAAVASVALAASAWEVPIYRVSGVINGVMGSIVESATHAGYAANSDTAAVVRVYGPDTAHPYDLPADVQRTREWVYGLMTSLGGSRYISSNATPGDPFPTYAALTNAIAMHTDDNPTLYYNGQPATPAKDDWCVVIADEIHLNPTSGDPTTTRWGFVGSWPDGIFQFQITLADTSFTEAQFAALNSTVTKDLVDWGWHMRTNDVAAITNALQTALTNVANCATNYTDAVADGLYTTLTNVSACATNYTDAATNALDAAHHVALTNAAVCATNYTDAATNALDAAHRRDLVPWVPDVNANLTAITVGSRAYGSAVGANSVAVGSGVTASGVNSFAAGGGCTATGDYAVAIGVGTFAGGNYSHAEGGGSRATMGYSHAEGSGTQATNVSAHAEGSSTRAFGAYSHAEGSGALAEGQYAHAEGGGTEARGYGSHAEGGGTHADGSYTHSEGSGTHAEGNGTHAEGGGTSAAGEYTHAEGTGTHAEGTATHAEGGGTSAYGSNTHAEGGGTSAYGSNTHAEGGGTTANGMGSHAEGGGSIADGNYTHAEGTGTRALGNGTHAEGSNTLAAGQYTHAEGCYTVTTGMYAHAEGGYTRAGNPAPNKGLYTHAEGFNASATNTTAYTWNGSASDAPSVYPEDPDYVAPYADHGNGTYNVNPVGGVEGVWIGETNLADHIRNLAPPPGDYAAVSNAAMVTLPAAVGTNAAAIASHSSQLSQLSQAVDDHTGDTNNPHQVTAEQVRALPLSGGSMDYDAEITLPAGPVRTPEDSPTITLDYSGVSLRSKAESDQPYYGIRGYSTDGPSLFTKYRCGDIYVFAPGPLLVSILTFPLNRSGTIALTSDIPPPPGNYAAVSNAAMTAHRDATNYADACCSALAVAATNYTDAVTNGLLRTEADPTVDGKIATHNSSATAHSDIRTALEGKQPTIGDLAAIRSGAAAGATAVQPAAIADMETQTHAAATYQPRGSYISAEADPTVDGKIATHDSSATAHPDIRTALEGKQPTIGDLAAIRSGAAAGATAAQHEDLVLTTIRVSASNLTTAKTYIDNKLGEELYQAMLDISHPVGSHWIQYGSSDNPNALFNVNDTAKGIRVSSAWTQVAVNGCYIQLDRDATPGTAVAESLPNITGSVGEMMMSHMGASASGVYYGVGQWELGHMADGGLIMHGANLPFNAHNSSAVYQDNAAVHPKGQTATLWKRVN